MSGRKATIYALKDETGAVLAFCPTKGRLREESRAYYKLDKLMENSVQVITLSLNAAGVCRVLNDFGEKA